MAYAKFFNRFQDASFFYEKQSDREPTLLLEFEYSYNPYGLGGDDQVAFAMTKEDLRKLIDQLEVQYKKFNIEGGK